MIKKFKTNLTLRSIRDNKPDRPCDNGWELLLKSFNKTNADNTPVSTEHLLKTNGVSDTLWVLDSCVENAKIQKRNMVADFAESVLHVWEDWAKDNAPEKFEAPRSLVEACRRGKISKEIVDAARVAARNGGMIWNDGDKWVVWTRLAAWDAEATVAWAAQDVAAEAWDSQAAGKATATEREKQKQIILKYFE